MMAKGGSQTKKKKSSKNNNESSGNNKNSSSSDSPSTSDEDKKPSATSTSGIDKPLQVQDTGQMNEDTGGTSMYAQVTKNTSAAATPMTTDTSKPTGLLTPLTGLRPKSALSLLRTKD